MLTNMSDAVNNVANALRETGPTHVDANLYLAVMEMPGFSEEALVPAPVGGGAPSIGSGPPDDLNYETPTLRSEPTLGSNPTVSNVHIVLYSLFNIFRRLSGGTPLSPLKPPCNQSPYDLVPPADAYAWGL